MAEPPMLSHIAWRVNYSEMCRTEPALSTIPTLYLYVPIHRGSTRLGEPDSYFEKTI